MMMKIKYWYKKLCKLIRWFRDMSARECAPFVVITIRPFFSSFIAYHRVCSKFNTTGTTSGARTAYHYGPLSSLKGFDVVRVGWSLVFCVDHCSFVLFGDCIVYPVSIQQSSNFIQWQLIAGYYLMYVRYIVLKTNQLVELNSEYRLGMS